MQHEAAAPQAGSRSFFSEIISSISDVRFSRDGRHLLSRDYMTVKLWDLNMESKPVASFPVHEPLREKVQPIPERGGGGYAPDAVLQGCARGRCSLVAIHRGYLVRMCVALYPGMARSSFSDFSSQAFTLFTSFHVWHYSRPFTSGCI